MFGFGFVVKLRSNKDERNPFLKAKVKMPG
jgi:hypothetical protein